MLIELKLNMKTVFNTDFHFHLCLCLSLFYIAIVVHDCKINLFGYGGFHVTVDYCSDEISDSSCNTIKCLIFLFKVRELELELSVFGEETCGFQLL